MPIFCPVTAHFGGFEGIFSYINDKSAILCPAKTEVADFVSFKGSILQGMNLFYPLNPIASKAVSKIENSKASFFNLL